MPGLAAVVTAVASATALSRSLEQATLVPATSATVSSSESSTVRRTIWTFWQSQGDSDLEIVSRLNGSKDAEEWLVNSTLGTMAAYNPGWEVVVLHEDHPIVREFPPPTTPEASADFERFGMALRADVRARPCLY